MNTFDLGELQSRIGGLATPLHRVAFAASCATRLRTSYAFYVYKTGCGNSSLIEGALDCLWQLLAGPDQAKSSCEEYRAGLQDLLEKEDEPYLAESPYGEDAAAATLYAIEAALDDDCGFSAWAASRVCDLIFTHLTSPSAVDLNDPEVMRQIQANELLQAELIRQARDLKELETMDTEALVSLASQMRRRAEMEQALHM